MTASMHNFLCTQKLWGRVEILSNRLDHQCGRMWKELATINFFLVNFSHKIFVANNEEHEKAIRGEQVVVDEAGQFWWVKFWSIS